MISPATPLSFAATGLQAASSIFSGFTAADNAMQQGQQTAEMDAFKAQQLADQAEAGKAQAMQTDSFMRSRLMTTEENMNAIRATNGSAGNSPSDAAILARTQGQGDEARAIKVGDLYVQSAETKKEGDMYTNAANETLAAASANASSDIFMGILGGVTKVLSGVSGLPGIGLG